MNTLLQILLNGIKDLESCIENAKNAILTSYEDDSVIERLSFYDEALNKITNEVEWIHTLEEHNDHAEIDQCIKRIVELSNMIKEDTIDLLLTLETGFNSTQDVEKWN